MMNKVILGLLIGLLVLVGGLGYYAWTAQQQLDLMREELSAFQDEQAARTEAISSELTSLNNELQSGLDSLGADIDENASQITDLQDDTDSSQDVLQSLEKEVSDNLDRIDTLDEKLSETVFFADSVINAPDLYRRVSEAVVRISNGQGTAGSGFIYDSEGHVLTAYHVIDGLDEIYAVMPGGKIYPADVVGSCALSDVAVLQLDDEPGVEPLGIADSNRVEVGDPVAAIGSPFDLPESLSTGIVSQVNRYAEITQDGQTRWVANLIQFDAAVNFGNSGGPLFGSDGNVIGLTIARVEPAEGDGIYYAVSSNKFKRVADAIIDQGRFDYPWLGVSISDLTPQQVQELALESIHGVLVNQVIAGSPAGEAGVQADDIIIAIDGAEVENLAVLRGLVGQEN